MDWSPSNRFCWALLSLSLSLSLLGGCSNKGGGSPAAGQAATGGTGVPAGGGGSAAATPISGEGGVIGTGGTISTGGTTGAAGTIGTIGTGGMSSAAGAGASGMTSDAGTPDAAANSDAGGSLGGPLMYTGAFTMGSSVPARNKCPMDAIGGGSGENKSPALSWTGGPAETKSFAIVLYDTRYNMLHWVLWDIPANVHTLPEGLPSGYALTAPAGAHQVASMGSDPHAYYGPCSSGSFAGSYEYRLYALDTAMLALTESSTGADAQAAVEAAMLEKTVWTGMPQ